MLNADPAPVNSRIQSIDRAAELLEAIAAAPEPETAPALADACGLNRSTAWRILATLEHHGLVERDPETNRYRPRLRACSGSRRPPGHEPLVRLAQPILRRLAEASGETVNLAVARRLELVYADQVQARHVMAPNWLGHAVPLHATSTGKAFLAALPEDELEHARRARALHRHDDHRRCARCAPSSPPSARAASRCRTASSSRRCGACPPPRCDRAGRPAAVVSVWGAESRVRERLDELGALAADAAARARGAAQLNAGITRSATSLSWLVDVRARSRPSRRRRTRRGARR